MDNDFTYPGFSSEELRLIESIKDLLNSPSASKTLVRAMIGLIEDVVESGGLLITRHNLEFLYQISTNPDIRVMIHYKRSPVQCPECEGEMVALCGRLQCYSCNIDFYQETDDSRKQCLRCISFRDNQDPRYKTMVEQGFGEGCSGVKNKFNEVELYRNLSPHGINPQLWNRGIRSVEALKKVPDKLKGKKEEDMAPDRGL